MVDVGDDMIYGHNGVDQEIPPEVGRADSVGDGHDNDHWISK